MVGNRDNVRDIVDGVRVADSAVEGGGAVGGWRRAQPVRPGVASRITVGIMVIGVGWRRIVTVSSKQSSTFRRRFAAVLCAGVKATGRRGPMTVDLRCRRCGRGGRLGR